MSIRMNVQTCYFPKILFNGRQMNFVSNDTNHVLYLENSFSTTTYDLIHLGIIQQLKNKRLRLHYNLPLAKCPSMYVVWEKTESIEFKSHLADGSVMSVWHLKRVLNGSCEWPGVNHTATYKCIILKKLDTIMTIQHLCKPQSAELEDETITYCNITGV